MNTSHSRSLNVSSPLLFAQLNQLLASLDLPFTVQSHRDLTPALLICILETLREARLVLAPGDRAALFTSRAAKERCMKIFLGVLQGDVLRTDVGLSGVDPRLLASGVDTETVFVGRVLCWYGRRLGLITRARSPSTLSQVGGGRGSPSTLTNTTITRHTATSPVRAQPNGESDTSVSAASGSDTDAHEPRCIHEVPEPTLVLSPASAPPELDSELSAFTSEHEASASAAFTSGREQTQNTSVRYTGYIQLVDQDAEIAAFEARRALDRQRVHAEETRPAQAEHRRRGMRRQHDPNPRPGAADGVAGVSLRRIAADPSPQPRTPDLSTELARRVALLRAKADALVELYLLGDYV
ncbi:hypothetical protein B0H17DRAFT_1027405 [Mycena rosella]|uniref:DUF5745 domain-containing protein n=1 Tax=Mycena rosella TaxID=1033263 RepID=A0AAD7H2D2_MYCRO|nr:hypothetical protein B0H17DRAFT_1027405 [Mycena rosella]